MWHFFRVLWRNTGSISAEYKDTKLFKLALVTYAALYGKYVIAPEIPDIAEDATAYALSEYLNKDYEVIATLPEPLPEKCRRLGCVLCAD